MQALQMLALDEGMPILSAALALVSVSIFTPLMMAISHTSS
jgi:hypothetical protein